MAQEKGAEPPIDKYYRFKNNYPFLWEQEMKKYGLTKEEKENIEHIYAPAYGCPSIQEDLMVLLMENANFTLAEANDARKIVAKKQMSRIPELQEKIFKKIPHKGFAQYIWDTGVKPQLGYAFSKNHSLPYSFVGIQTIILATLWNQIYWNTACLIVNSGSLEDDYETEEEDNKKEKSTDYGKIATALGDIISKGIKVSLVDINNSDFSFKPDIKNNQILFGMKALNGVGAAIIEKIISGRPYSSFKDFLRRCPLNKTAMVSLIKGGSFDLLEKEWSKELNIEPRYLIMIYYLLSVSEPKNKLTLSNFNGLLQRNMIPEELNDEKEYFLFNKKLKSNKFKEYYLLDDNDEKWLENNEILNLENDISVIDGRMCIFQKLWDKYYRQRMDSVREWLKINQESLLNEFNKLLFMNCWEKYAKGTISAWEMESLCFYYHEHELSHVDNRRYGISNFFNLPEQPVVDRFFKRNGIEIPLYKLDRIIGTVIGKKDSKSSISLLTVDGVVNVKFTKEYFAMFNRQISEVQSDGTKKVKEKGWFTRGTKLMITGFRREDTFVAKKYSKTPGHTLYKITNVNNNNGTIELQSERFKIGEDEQNG